MFGLRAKRPRRVGLLLPHGYSFCAAFLGALFARASIVALDPKWPLHRLSTMAQAADLHVIITLEKYASLASRIEGVECCVLLDDRLSAHVVNFKGAGAQYSADNEEAYIVFTSGTTGHPKGVPISHANLAPLLHWQEHAFQLGPHLRSVQVLPVTFDFGLEEIMNVLCFGGTLIIPSDDECMSAELYGKALMRHKATMLYTTPSFLRQLFSYAAFEAFDLILVGGEVFDGPSAQRLMSSIKPSARVFNGYGPTEATITATVYQLDGNEAYRYPQAGSVPIGKPCAANSVYILDERLQPVPPGVSGEIYIGGPGVARGYLNGKRGRFIADPFSQTGTLYKTGDRGRQLHDGVIEFLGRFDRQTKVRGFRVEPDEVAVAVRRLPNISAAHVQVEIDTAGQNVLIAYCVSSAPDLTSDFDMESRLRQVLPSHMIPRVRFVKSMPLTENGKIDAAKLDRLGIRLQSRKSSKESGLLATVLECWQEVLNTPHLSPDQNVFEFGAHSLNVATAHKLITERSGLQFPLITLFEYYNARKLTHHLLLASMDTGNASRGAARRLALSNASTLSGARR